MIAQRIAPGLRRSHYGFTGWLGHDDAVWQQELALAREAIRPANCQITGTDKDKQAIAIALENAKLAGVENSIEFLVKDLFAPDFTVESAKGLMLTNPPYGERLSADDTLYQHMGAAVSEHFAGWQCGIFTADTAPLKQARLPLKPLLSLKNGSIDCQLFDGRVPAMSAAPAKPSTARASYTDETASTPPDAQPLQHKRTTEKSVSFNIDIDAFVNRIKKNQKRLKAWRKREQVTAWRIYDADLPEFAVAIDVYDCDQRYVVVQEYQAPETVNVAMAEARLQAILQALPAVLEVEAQCVHLKVRHKQAGSEQYQKHASSNITGTIAEHGYQLSVNFSDYLDTGLFLDHRKVRRYIQEQSSGNRFLNLFCYTGSATVAAASGGAKHTTSVDLSNRYTQWLTRNLQLNQLPADVHNVVRSDVLTWIKEYNGPAFDLILLDPPTFSNSTDVEDDWNLQRDHVACIDACMSMLSSDGTLVFSNNYRRFKLSGELMADSNDKALKPGRPKYRVEDRSRWSIDVDFQRNARIHQCWFITHNEGEPGG